MLEYYVKKQNFRSLKSGQKTEKYYAKLKEKALVTTEDICRKVELSCTMTRHEVGLAIDEITDVILDELESGRPVQLGKLGIFHPGIQSESKQTADEVTIAAIKRIKCTFRPSGFFKKFLQSLQIQRMKYIHKDVK